MPESSQAPAPMNFIAAVLESECGRFTLCRADRPGAWDLFDDGEGGVAEQSVYIGEFDCLVDAITMARAIPLIEAKSKLPAVNYTDTDTEE